MHTISLNIKLLVFIWLRGNNEL